MKHRRSSSHSSSHSRRDRRRTSDKCDNRPCKIALIKGPNGADGPSGADQVIPYFSTIYADDINPVYYYTLTTGDVREDDGTGPVPTVVTDNWYLAPTGATFDSLYLYASTDIGFGVDPAQDGVVITATVFINAAPTYAGFVATDLSTAFTLNSVSATYESSNTSGISFNTNDLYALQISIVETRESQVAFNGVNIAASFYIK